MSKNNLRDIHLDEISLVDAPANQGARVVLVKRAEDVKTVDGVAHPKDHFAYTPGGPSTWKLLIHDSRHVGMAIAALGPGFRGQKVGIPGDELAGVKARIRAAWKKFHPDAAEDEIPDIIKRGLPNGELQKAGAPGNNPSEKDMDMTIEELQKKLGDLESQVADLTKSRDASVAKFDTLAKAATDAGFTVADSENGVTITKAVTPEYVEVNGEQVIKSAVPAPVLKMLEDQATAIAKMQADQEFAVLAKRADDELPNLPGTPAERGALLKAVDGLDDATKGAVTKALKAADAAVGKMFTTVGKNIADDEASATYRLNKMAGDYAAKNSVTFEKAFAEVTANGEGRSLLVESRNEK